MQHNTIVIGMSGGVDSSMVALLLKKSGHHCIGVHMKLWKDDTLHNRSDTATTSKENIAQAMCEKLGIPFYVWDARSTFKELVVDAFLKAHEEGHIPNPCVTCNRFIKFGAFLDYARSLGATHVATGHYAQVICNRESNMYELHEGKDTTKDQSYFLSMVSQEQLSKILTPLGTLTKKYVRDLANREGFTYFDSSYKESQGVCFLDEQSPDRFLRTYLPHRTVKGNIETLEGKKLGTHRGLQKYTIGQRRGIDIGGQNTPLYVHTLDWKNNVLIVAPKNELYNNTLVIRDLHMINPEEDILSIPLTARIRYGMDTIPCRVTPYPRNSYMVSFSEPVYAITPGQVTVFYDKHRLIGGGIIEKVLRFE